MRFLNIFNNKESVEERSYNATIESLFSNRVFINEGNVLKIPVVAESIQKICGTVASLPIDLMLKDQFKNTIINDDIRLYLLNIENNEYQTAYNYKHRVVSDLVLYGKSYSFIERKSGKIKSLWPIDFKSVTEQDIINAHGTIEAKYINFTLNNRVLKENAYNLLIIDSGNKGILNSNKLLELMQQHDEALEAALKNISLPSGYLKAEGRLTQTTIDRMRESWKNLYSGSRNAAKTIILEEGLDYKSLDINLNNIQSIENKKEFVADVQRLFNLYDLKSDSEYLKYCISPIVSCIESSLTTQLLTSEEKSKNMMFKFDCEMVDRATEKERIESIALAVDKGLLTINEARLRLDENAFLLDSEEEFLSISQGKIMLMKDSRLVIPNMASAINIENGQVISGSQQEQIDENKGDADDGKTV
ncbi:phage portal protein [Clostridium sp.]|uniref:phage portal protein n=1 Tax=Clostridium sp. TaxID=1506 RepID=UPI0025C490B3|nr:phage portal protein [Clostridium sp.]